MTIEFRPGFRLSTTDIIVLIGATAGAILSYPHSAILASMIIFVVAHFFLFCNLVRMSRLLELIWSGVFLLLAVFSLAQDSPPWAIILCMSSFVTVVLVALEVRKDSYHGVLWKRVNPDLQTWFAENSKPQPTMRGSAPKRPLLRSPLGVWTAVGVVLALSSQLLIEYLWILGVVPHIAWLGAGLVLIAMPLLRALGATERASLLRTAALRLAVVVTVVVLASSIKQLGAWCTMHGRFALNHRAYDRVVETLRASPPSSSGLVREHLAIVDLGPPLRVAFTWPGGIVDNWCGAVYDPTGVVLEANAFNGNWETWHDQVPSDVINLFGGELVSCRALSQDYFHCCFT